MIASGRVVAAAGGSLRVRIPGLRIGDGIRVCSSGRACGGIVRALESGTAIVAAHGAINGVAAGDHASVDAAVLRAPLGMRVLGRAFDAASKPLDGRGSLRGRLRRVYVRAPSACARRAAGEPFWCGVRAIDGLLTIARGARIGIFGAPGAGKSTLLHMLAQAPCADAAVIGLVGERGREAEEWIAGAGAHTTVICATSDCSAAERVRAAWLAMAQADALRSLGLHVLLIVDSLARYGAALRELAVAQGESCGRGGFPASVFSDLAAYVEIAGCTAEGSITLVATVLSDGDDRDPLSDAARSLLDGHVTLSSAMAQSGRFPAIDVLSSASRTMSAVVAPEHRLWAQAFRARAAALAQSEDARRLGLVPAEAAEGLIEGFLRQGTDPSEPSETLGYLKAIADTLEVPA